MSPDDTSAKLSYVLTPYTAREEGRSQIARAIHCKGSYTGRTIEKLDPRKVLYQTVTYLAAYVDRHSIQQRLDDREELALWVRAAEFQALNTELSWPTCKPLAGISVKSKVTQSDSRRTMLPATKLTVNKDTGEFEFTISTSNAGSSVLPDPSHLVMQRVSSAEAGRMESAEDDKLYQDRLRGMSGLTETDVEAASQASLLMEALAMYPDQEAFKSRLEFLADERKADCAEHDVGPVIEVQCVPS